MLSKTYQNVNFLTFGDAVRQFFIDAKIPSEHPPLTACIACAGPVKDNEVTMTNHDHWVINGEEIKEMFGIRHVSIINDFVAQGYGLLGLQPEELIVLQVLQCFYCCVFKYWLKSYVRMLREKTVPQ